MNEKQETLYAEKTDIISENKIKAIELNMQNIARMADNSAKCKNFCITIITAVIAFLLTTKNINSSYFMTGILTCITMIFWYLDAKYLQLERAFVKKAHDILYVIEIPTGYFNFNPIVYIKNYNNRVPSIIKTMFSWSCSFIYCGLIVIILLLQLLIIYK